MMRVALYARVSLDETADDKRYQEPENQLEPLREYCKARGWEIVGEYVDRASGGDSNRPQFKAMRMAAHQLRFKGIVVWKMDRFSREGISNTLAYIQDLKRFGVGVISITEPWLDTTADSKIGEIILSVISWAAENERINIGQRTSAGIRKLRAIGQWKGGRPKGSRDKKPRKKRGGRVKQSDNIAI